jgi:AbrB family looped-hinge helix DNA binding protein
METIDEEVTEHALAFIDRCHKEGEPFFVWYNTTAMHFRTHCAEKHKSKSGQGDYNDVMVAHDENVGRMLAKLNELGIADDTIVMYSTDNGPHYNSWPDAAITPFRSGKNTNWEGGWRVPIFVRWPGKIKPGTVLNDIASQQDWLPTLLAAAGPLALLLHVRIRSGRMRITSKGQVTIPADIRERAGLLPCTDVDFEFDGKVVRIMRAKTRRKDGRGTRLVAHLRGRGDVAMSTDEIMALTRAD